jgi:23S rRNA (uracil1939-C5)-methyltransferase
MLKAEFSSFVLYLNINDKDNNVILSDRWQTVEKYNEIEKVEGVFTKIHPAGFFQVNDFIRRKMYEKVAYVLKNLRTDVIIDAYSGAGILTSFFSSYADKVYGIEINEQAHESAVALSRNNGISNMIPILGDVKEHIGKVLDEHIGKRVAVVLDPPRSGCDKSVIECINSNEGIGNLVYVSCNPATLARDLSMLTNYEILSVTPYDMFPQTVNVETLVCLKRK